MQLFGHTSGFMTTSFSQLDGMTVTMTDPMTNAWLAPARTLPQLPGGADAEAQGHGAQLALAAAAAARRRAGPGAAPTCLWRIATLRPKPAMKEVQETTGLVQHWHPFAGVLVHAGGGVDAPMTDTLLLRAESCCPCVFCLAGVLVQAGGGVGHPQERAGGWQRRQQVGATLCFTRHPAHVDEGAGRAFCSRGRTPAAQRCTPLRAVNAAKEL